MVSQASRGQMLIQAVSDRSVLIVEDNDASRKLARIVLGEAGFEVHTAVDAEDALDQLARISPRVILTDLQLPGMQGLELVRRLASDPRRAKMVVIAFTANCDKSDVECAKAAGCDDFIAKPIDLDCLIDTVRRAFWA